MLLYHGSNIAIKEVRLIPSKRFLDFGAGFYLTSDYEQAKRWAERTANRRREGSPTVTVFHVEEAQLEMLRILTFPSADKDWLRFISANRTGATDDTDYDIIVGPVANDQAIRTINNFLKGYFSEEVAIQLLLPQKLKDQYAFKTERALAILDFQEAKQL